MTVTITDFKAAGARWEITHTDTTDGVPHVGLVLPTSIGFAQSADGSTDYRGVGVVCPVCGARSVHPIGGGAAAPSVQEMAIRMMIRLGCPCGALIPGRPPAVVITHARNHVSTMESASRWQTASIVP